jgi:hypothetical protein
VIGKFRFRLRYAFRCRYHSIFRFRPKFRSQIELKTEILVDLSDHLLTYFQQIQFFFQQFFFQQIVNFFIKYILAKNGGGPKFALIGMSFKHTTFQPENSLLCKKRRFDVISVLVSVCSVFCTLNSILTYEII